MLKYLFEVTYQDGSTFNQNAEDVSATDPKRSAFFDVKLGQIKTFSLVGEGHRYMVDLEDGHFEIDGASFRMRGWEFLTNFRLIFWRQRDHIWPPGEEVRVVYLLGWQANDRKGRNIQRVLEID